MAIIYKNPGIESSDLEIEKQTRIENLDIVKDMWNGKGGQGHKHHTYQGGCKQRTSKYENTPLNSTSTDCAVVERIMKNKNGNGYKHHLPHALHKYFQDFSHNSAQGSFVDAS